MAYLADLQGILLHRTVIHHKDPACRPYDSREIRYDPGKDHLADRLPVSHYLDRVFHSESILILFIHPGSGPARSGNAERQI